MAVFALCWVHRHSHLLDLPRSDGRDRMTSFGDELAQLMHARGRERGLGRDLGVREVARDMFVNPGHVSNLRSGRARASEQLAARLDSYLNAGGSLIRAWKHDHAAMQDGRSTAVRKIAVRPGSAGVPAGARPYSPPWPGGGEAEDAERLGSLLGHPASADLVTAAYLRQQVQRLDERYVHVPSTVLLAEAGQCLGQGRVLAARSGQGRVRREWLAGEAGAAILMGQLVWDGAQRRDHGSARLYLDQAIGAARQVRDPAAEGLALLRKAMVALYGERDPRAGLALAEQAAQAARPVSDALPGLAMLHAAEAHAMLGDRIPCERVLADAERVLGRVSDSDVAAGLYSETQLSRMAGSCYLFLGNVRQARGLLEITAASLTDGSKAQAIVLGNLALAHIGQGDLDQAAGRLHQAIDIIELNWGGGGLNVVFEAAGKLCSWRDAPPPAARDVHERLLSLMAR